MEKLLSCLLIDDDHDDQEIFRVALNRVSPDINCSFANDGVFALEKLQTDDILPEFIFLDINMPRLNGMQCLAEIKKIEALKDIPVFIYSTSGQPDMVKELKKLGAADFFLKTPHVSELEGALKSIVQRLQMPA
jgi:PleD family two-component response regulator